MSQTSEQQSGSEKSTSVPGAEALDTADAIAEAAGLSYARGGRIVAPARRARVRLTWVSPWSVAKIALLTAIAVSACTLAAVTGLYELLAYAGVFDTAQRTVNSILPTGSGTSVSTQVALPVVLQATGAVCALLSVLAIIACVLGAFVYNLSARLSGGIEILLRD